MKTKSIWGYPPKRLYNLIKIAKKEFGNNFRTCIVGCSDGKFLIPFARSGLNVTGYDVDEIALYGGTKKFPLKDIKEKFSYSKNFKSQVFELESRKVIGIIKRLEIENLSKYAHIEKRDFYKNIPQENFEVVFTSCSLHYSLNQEISLETKTKMLQSIVLNNGYLYIDYMMAIDESNYEKYPKNKFYRKGEMEKYFDDSWQIISLKENNKPSFEAAHVDCVVDHFHRFGYILAKKKESKS